MADQRGVVVVHRDDPLPHTYQEQCVKCARDILYGHHATFGQVTDLANHIERAVEFWLDTEAERGR